MNFCNETMHPEAYDLTTAILAGAIGPDAPFYEPLEAWRNTQGMTDECASDLYSLIAETFETVPVHSITRDQAVSKMSRCLWINHKRYPRGY